MFSNSFQNFFSFPDINKVDFLFFGLFIFLCLFGLLATATSSVQFSDSLTGEALSFFTRQSFHLLVGLLLFGILKSVPLNFWESFDRLLLGFGILLLVLVFVPGIGIEVKGANRWLRIGPIGLQPSEIMKFIIIVSRIIVTVVSTVHINVGECDHAVFTFENIKFFMTQKVPTMDIF